MDEFGSFGTWLRQRRKTLALSQDALARRASCSLGDIRKLEPTSGRPDLRHHRPWSTDPIMATGHVDKAQPFGWYPLGRGLS
jgi:hypothetical protein